MSRVIRALSPVASGAGGARRSYTDVQLINDLKRAADALGKITLSQTEYAEEGDFSFVNICRRFGSWKAALAKAGLEPANLMNISAEELLADIQRVAKQFEPNDLRANQYTQHGKYSRKIVDRLFGRWQTACEAAGLKPVIARPLNERELFENFKWVWQKLGRTPCYEDLKPPLSKFGVTAYTQRFLNALKVFLEWQAGTHIEKTERKRGPRTINLRLRFFVLSRDRYRCCACGRSPATDPGVKLEVDHIHPWSAGGETTAENLQALCQACNIGKSDSH